MISQGGNTESDSIIHTEPVKGAQMGTNAITLPNTKNKTSGRVHHALQLREQSVREADEERTGIIDTREDKRLRLQIYSGK